MYPLFVFIYWFLYCLLFFPSTSFVQPRQLPALFHLISFFLWLLMINQINWGVFPLFFLLVLWVSMTASFFNLFVDCSFLHSFIDELMYFSGVSHFTFSYVFAHPWQLPFFTSWLIFFFWGVCYVISLCIYISATFSCSYVCIHSFVQSVSPRVQKFGCGDLEFCLQECSPKKKNWAWRLRILSPRVQSQIFFWIWRLKILSPRV